MKQALILAAGIGSRLRPLTDTLPKALVPFHGRPLLEWLILRLKAAGYRRLIINLHHHGKQVIRFIRERNAFGLEIYFSPEETLLDTGGAIKRAARYFDPEQPLLVHNADIISDIPLDDMERAHRTAQADVTLAVNERSTSRYFLFDEEGRLRGWENTTTGERKWAAPGRSARCRRRAFCGIHLLSPRLIDAFPERERFSIVPEYLNLADTKKIRAYDATPYRWADLGTPEKIRDAEVLFPVRDMVLMTDLS